MLSNVNDFIVLGGCYQVQPHAGAIAPNGAAAPGWFFLQSHYSLVSSSLGFHFDIINDVAGLLGSYPAEASGFGPAPRGYMAAGDIAGMAAAVGASGPLAGTGGGGAAAAAGGCTYLNFSPQVTNTLTPGMTPVPGSVCTPTTF